MVKNKWFYKTESKVLSPVPGEYIGWHVTGGYASLTPGYYHITPNGVSE